MEHYLPGTVSVIAHHSNVFGKNAPTAVSQGSRFRSSGEAHRSDQVEGYSSVRMTPSEIHKKADLYNALPRPGINMALPYLAM